MISTLNDIKKGLTLNINGEPYLVVKDKFLRMQQRKPVMQTKLKNLITGKVLEYNFKPGERVEEADLARKKVNFLYRDNNEYYFMDNENYEQFFLSADRLGEMVVFFKEGMQVDALYFNGQPISVSLPLKMDFKIIRTEPGIRGDTAQGRTTKPATLETGAEINVPLFVKEGDVIRVNTETSEYVERVN